MEPILEINDLTKLYSNGRGVEHVTFQINKGDVVGLLGPNGSGKTTTMKAVVGMCPPDNGSIKIFGHSIEDSFEAAMQKVGCLIEMPAFYEHMTAYQNLKLMARLYPEVTDERIEHILKVVNLERYKKDKAGRFSLGMKQRLGIALALLSEPELIILDEPANGLDIEGIIHVREIINKLAKERGVSFLISSHIASELEKVCNKIAVIHEGSMLSFESIEKALQFNPTLEDYFLSKVKEKKGSVII